MDTYFISTWISTWDYKKSLRQSSAISPKRCGMGTYTCACVCTSVYPWVCEGRCQEEGEFKENMEPEVRFQLEEKKEGELGLRKESEDTVKDQSQWNSDRCALTHLPGRGAGVLKVTWIWSPVSLDLAGRPSLGTWSQRKIIYCKDAQWDQILLGVKGQEEWIYESLTGQLRG